MKQCTNCHAQLANDDRFCMTCGTSQVEKAPSDVKFCPGCQQIVSDNGKFCAHCGYQFNQDLELKVTPRNNKQISSIQPVPSKRKKKTIILGILAVLVVLLVGAVGFTTRYYSKDQQIERLVTALNSSKIDSLQDYVTTSDQSFELTKEALAPFKTYLEDNTENRIALLQELQEQPASALLRLTTDGKKFGVFPQYKINITPISYRVTTNIKDAKLFLDEEELAISDSDNFEFETEKIIPGTHLFKLQALINKEKVAVDLTTDIRDDNLSKVNLSVKTTTFEVTSNMPNADVVVNSKKIGQLKEGIFRSPKLILKENSKMHLELPTSAGEKPLKTEAVELALEKDAHNSFELNFADIIESADLEFFFNNFYSLVSSNTISYSSYDKTTLAEYFEHGKGNTDYKDFDTFIMDSIKSNVISDRDISLNEIEKVTRIAENKYTVQLTVSYDTHYSDSDKDSVYELFRYTKIDLIYEDANPNQFKIVSMGGPENFEKL